MVQSTCSYLFDPVSSHLTLHSTATMALAMSLRDGSLNLTNTWTRQLSDNATGNVCLFLAFTSLSFCSFLSHLESTARAWLVERMWYAPCLYAIFHTIYSISFTDVLAFMYKISSFLLCRNCMTTRKGLCERLATLTVKLTKGWIQAVKDNFKGFVLATNAICFSLGLLLLDRYNLV